MGEEQAKYDKSFDDIDKMMRQKPRPPRPGEENAIKQTERSKAWKEEKEKEKQEADTLTPQERKLLDVIKEIDYGEIDKIIVKRGQPVFVKMATKDIKLD